MSQRVSVVIPAYRAAGTICRAVDSVLAQTVPAHEIIVVDDGSPDHQNEVIERMYGERVILVRQANGKTASARNAGIERATGDFIAFLDADDYWEPAKLKKQLAVFARHPEVGIVAGNYSVREPDGGSAEAHILKRAKIAWNTVVVARGAHAFWCATWMWTGTILMRRTALGDKRFISGLEPAEDRDLWMQVVQEWPCFFLSEKLATYVLEPGSISRTAIERDCTSMLAVVRRHRRLVGTFASLQWLSHTYFRWGANESNSMAALPQILRSVLLWPLPYSQFFGVPPLGRLRRLLRVMIDCFPGFHRRRQRHLGRA